MSWQLRETAPKDGREILVGEWYNEQNSEPYFSQYVVSFEPGDNAWVPQYGTTNNDTPFTHWQPLPPPPKD